jgi:hypothetical protein
MRTQGGEFTAISIGAAVLAVLEIAAFSALMSLDSPALLTLGLLLAPGQAAWAAAVRLRGWGWAAAGVATVTYIVIVIAMYAIALSNHPPS